MYAAQLTLTVLPLVTLPWLTRALGRDEFGAVVFVQAFGSLLGILIGYGFYLSATRAIAHQRADREAMGTTVAGVLGGQSVLVALAAAATVVAAFLVPEFRADPRLALFGLVMGALQGLNPTWFFMGIERMRLQAAIEVTIRVLSAVAIVLLVRDEGDALLVLWIWTVANGAVTAILAVLMYRVVPLLAPALAAGIPALRSGWSLFVTASSVSLYTSATVFVLGLTVSTAQLALFSAGERVARAALRASQPLGAVTYPRVTFLVSTGEERQAQRLAVLTFIARTGLAAISALVLIVLAPVVVEVLLGPEFAGATPILRILALLIPLFAMSATLSQHWLLAHGHDRRTTRSAIVGGLASVGATLVVAPVAGIVGVAWSLVVVQSGVVLWLAFVVWREGLAPTRVQILRR